MTEYTLPELRLILAALSAVPLRGKESLQIALSAIAKTEQAVVEAEQIVAKPLDAEVPDSVPELPPA